MTPTDIAFAALVGLVFVPPTVYLSVWFGTVAYLRGKDWFLKTYELED